MKIKIGIMGSAQGPAIMQESNKQKAHMVGKAIAEADGIVVNGACFGLPHEAAIGAKENGGFVIGVSPAFSLKEHVERYKSPDEQYYDVLLFTGMGLMERDILNIRSSDAIIVIGGGIGTLNEFTVAFDEGRYIGVLTGTDGISSHIPDIVKKCHRELGDRIIFDDDPKKLVQRLTKLVHEGERMVLEDQRVVGLDFQFKTHYPEAAAALMAEEERKAA